MNIIQSLVITLSMYTAVPVPMISWNDRNLRYCMAFLPAAGLIIGAAEWLLFFLCSRLECSAVFFGAFFCALPVLITGKIHMDGLIDTCDALGSHGSREKKLEILEDSHAGAFGITGVILYVLLFAACAAEAYPYLTPVSAAGVCLSFAASRALTAVQIVTMDLSKERGLLFTFRRAASKKAVFASSAAVLILCLAAEIAVFSAGALFPAAAGLLFSLYFRRTAVRQFGGISGDLCGWMIHMQELMFLLSFLPALRLTAV